MELRGPEEEDVSYWATDYKLVDKVWIPGRNTIFLLVTTFILPLNKPRHTDR